MSKNYSIGDFLTSHASIGTSVSPDGSRVAYLHNATGTFQVYVTSTDGGEARQVTNYQDSVVFAKFSPTRNVLAFGKSDGGNEQIQIFLLNVETEEITPLTTDTSVRNDFGGWSPDGTKICFSANKRNGTDFEVYVMDVSTKETSCIFAAEGSSYSAEGFSPSGTYVAVRHRRSNIHSDIYLHNLETGENTLITSGEERVRYSRPFWFADESSLLVVQDAGRDFLGLGKLERSSKKFSYIVAPEWDVIYTDLDPTNTRVAVVVNEGGYGVLRVYNSSSFEEESYTLPEGSVHAATFSPDGSKLFFEMGSPQSVINIWCLDLEENVCRQLTSGFQGVPSEDLVAPELIHYNSFDGLVIPAFVYRPQQISPDKKLPVIINIHGGPEGQYRPTLNGLTQYFAHRGFMVVAPNVRGSSGYGKNYLALDDVEKRMDSVKDIVALREYLETYSEVDTEKMVLYGGSYGGFMVLANLAFYPELWAAGIDVVGIVNFVTFLENTAPYRRAFREAEYGSLAEHRVFLEKISPINSIERVQAPLFVIHGANDPRVPLSEAEQVVEKLKGLGREVEFLVYADEGHGLSKQKNRIDAYPKVITFLEKVLGL